MIATLRHVGILVKDLEKAKQMYLSLGFREIERERLEVIKMCDVSGNTIELVKGNWKPHVAVNWYSDGQGNLIEVVEEKR